MSPDMGDDEALGSMLISWYMSGYHTGYYLVCTQRLADLLWAIKWNYSFYFQVLSLLCSKGGSYNFQVFLSSSDICIILGVMLSHGSRLFFSIQPKERSLSECKLPQLITLP